MSNKFEINLASGETIRLTALLQHYTYAGLMDGLPIKRLNKKLVAKALDDAQERLWHDGTPYLIPPVETSMGYPKADWGAPIEEFEPVKLPAVACFTTFECSKPASDPEAHMSMLNIVWFQNELAMPIAPEILEAIRGLDWRGHAKDGWY